MPVEVVVWLAVGFVALIGLHELTHVLVARWHGHPTVCVAFSPLSVAVVFEDSPRPRYWLAQVILPAAVSWAVSYAWLASGLAMFSALQARPMVDDPMAFLPILVTLLTLLTSGGDLATAVVEVRKPLWGEARVHRDFQVLRKIPGVVLFTSFGRERWQAAWETLKAGHAPTLPAETGAR